MLCRGTLLVAVCALVLCGCGDPEAKESRATGEACGWGQQCEGGICLGEELGGEPTGFVAGMCSELCTDMECPGEGICADLGDGLYCLPGCGGDAECREGYICHPLYNACFPDCRHELPCPPDYTCGAEGRCKFDLPDVLPVGAPCAENSECAGNMCIPQEDAGAATGWKDGMCTVPCGPPPGGEGAVPPCPPETGCVVRGDIATCLPICFGPPDGDMCREGYVCDPNLHACVPDCRNGFACAPQLFCSPMGFCVTPRGPGGPGGRGGPGGPDR